MGKIILKAEGFDADIALLADRVVIIRKGIFNALKYGFNAKTEIPLIAISEVTFRPPILLGMGTIDFIRSGRANFDMKRGSSTAVKFKKINLPQFEAMKEKVFELMGQLHKQQSQQ
jgi:hypothetical protein